MNGVKKSLISVLTLVTIRNNVMNPRRKQRFLLFCLYNVCVRETLLKPKLYVLVARADLVPGPSLVRRFAHEEQTDNR